MRSVTGDDEVVSGCGCGLADMDLKVDCGEVSKGAGIGGDGKMTLYCVGNHEDKVDRIRQSIPEHRAQLGLVRQITSSSYSPTFCDCCSGLASLV